MAAHPRSTAHLHLLFIGTHGHVAALEKDGGREVWRVSLPGTGYSVVSILYEDDRLFCASGGHVFALDPESGKILWKNTLPSLGHGLVFVTTACSNDTEAVMTALAAQSAADEASRSSSSHTH